MSALVIGLARLRASMDEAHVSAEVMRDVLIRLRGRHRYSSHHAAEMLGMTYRAYRQIETTSEDVDLILHCCRVIAPDPEIRSCLNRIVNERIAIERIIE